MKRWFLALPIHRKLVAAALFVSSAALVTALTGLAVFDIWRFRGDASTDVVSLGRIIAETTSAAVVFEDPDAARETLETVRVRPEIRRACLYLPDGTLFAGYGRTIELTCPLRPDTPSSWRVVADAVPVIRNAQTLGTVYIERDLTGIAGRIELAAAAGAGMLVLAGGFAFGLAYRLNRVISTPITQLAAAARAMGREEHDVLLPANAVADEISELAAAFEDMVRRVHQAAQDREALLAREREASRLKDEFLAAVSHELRTPLNAMMGWVQILAKTPQNEETLRKAIASMSRNAQAQTRVIEDLVDVSRIVTGKFQLRLEVIDLRDAIREAVDLNDDAAHARGLSLQWAIPATPCLINGDRDRLQQILGNLLSNAIKFTPAEGRITVEAVPEDGACRIVVTDSGIGIAADFLPYVFDRFRQADGSTTRQHGGLGLGLALVKELTELHGGSVVAASAGPGRGASFVLRFPELAGLGMGDTAPRRSIDSGAPASEPNGQQV